MTESDGYDEYEESDEDDSWKQEAIKKDIFGALKKFGKGKTIIVTFLKIKSLGDEKCLKIEMNGNLYYYLNRYGINFEDPRIEKFFDDDRDAFMKMVDGMGIKAEIVEKELEYKFLFRENNNNGMKLKLR